MTGLNWNVLNEQQAEAVKHESGPLLILAGAGSGKTRVITYRIAHLLEKGVSAWNILAVTFTNKAAAEMRERVYQLTAGTARGVWISTFHSFCAQFLRTEGKFFGLEPNFTIYDQDDQKKLIKECLQELGFDEKKLPLSLLANRISRAKDQMMDAESFAISAAAAQDPQKETVAAVYTLYQKKLNRALALDFGDLLLKTVQLLQQHETLRRKYQERFHHVLVDEYQDTNRAQYVLSKTLAAQHKNICVVGDDDQSIYSWRGADIRNILDFEKDYQQVRVVKLEQNYRSTEPILTAAWKLVQNNRLRKDKKLWTERQSPKPVHFECLEDELSEASWIVSVIEKKIGEEGKNYADFALFYRTNAQSRVLEDTLRRRQIPYILVGNVRFYERAEVKDVLAYLKTAANPKDNISLKRIINFPTRGIGKTTIEAIERRALEQSCSMYEALCDDAFLYSLPLRARTALGMFRGNLSTWIKDSATLTVFQLLKNILHETKILSLLEENSKVDIENSVRLDNVQELLNATEEFEEKSELKTTAAYLEQVSLMTDLDSLGEKNNGVTLMTVHIAKGLEFPTVFLTGLEEGLFPLGEAQFDIDNLEEERRLAYVGMTRAKDELFLTAASSRKLFGQTHWNMPSRFILEAGIDPGVPIKNSSDSSENWDENSDSVPQKFSVAPTVETQSFRIGQRVRHPEFGLGRISDCSGSANDLKVTVQFESGSWKKLLIKYAPLQKV